jgi:oligosaccharide repeat unit polymerase
MSNNSRYEPDYRASVRTAPNAIRPSRCLSTASTIFAIHAGVLSLLAVVGLAYYYRKFSVDSFYHPACIILSGLIVWWYWSWIVFSRAGWFDPYILFLTAAVLFNCGQPIIEALGLNENSLLRDHFSEEVSLATLYLVAVGISALHFGVLLSTALWSGRSLRTNRDTFRELHLRNVYRVGVSLLLISAVPAVLHLQAQLQSVMAGGYVSLYQQQADVGLAAFASILSNFLVPGFALVIAGGRRKPLMRTFSLLGVFFWSAVALFLGGRANALMPAVGMLWLWDRTVHRISRTALIGGALIMWAIVFPVMNVTREESGVDRLSLDHMQRAYTEINNPMVAELSEMGYTANTIGWTMELVPRVRPFAWGGTYLSAILTLVPNLSSTELHPAMRLFGYDIPDYWLTWEIEPAFASHGGSYGYSFIAEAYLNFGWAAPVALFVLGAVFGRLRGWTLNSNDPGRTAIMGIFLSSVLFLSRSSLMSVVRPLFWYALVPYLVIALFDLWSSSRRGSLPGPAVLTRSTKIRVLTGNRI